MPHSNIPWDAADSTVDDDGGHVGDAGHGTQGHNQGGNSAKIFGARGTQSDTGPRGTSAEISGARGTQFVQGPRGTSAEISD